ncbi:non-ribosomal peptide synthetase [Streptomyces sp. NRRL B-3648]|uniref:non-ribosomal peptide synthetase n=1 Tax=Streptomyces sp. NRRL B-3648 TaxID=1519493 RepID=UPI0006AF5915|nr:non-ribosomal peptide synthetase [Streptomyces sp. NRRL B-3648]
MDRGDGRTTSFSQQRLWFLDQLRPGTADHLLPLALRLRGGLDTEALAAALTDVTDRHEVLRTRFTAADGEPVAHVVPRVEVPLETVEAPAADAAGIAAVLDRAVRRPVDLSTAPPLRATLARLGPGDHLLVIVVHHIAFDFSSWNVLTRDLAAAYRARTTGAPAGLPELPLQYADLAARQRERSAGPRLARGLDHWRSRLAGLPPLDLPTDRPRPAEFDGTAAVARCTLPADLVAAADRLARARRATRFMVLLAAFQAQLGRYSGQQDFAVGTPVAGRGHSAARDLIGPFVNTVVLRADLSGRPGFGALVDRVRKASLADLTHADTPFERVVGELAPPRDLSRNPLFQVSFLTLDSQAAPPDLPGLSVEVVPTPVAGTPFDLALDLLGRPDGSLGLRLQYATALFAPETAARITEDYVRLLRELLAAPDEPLARATAVLEPLPGGERRRRLALGLGSARTVPPHTVTDLFEEQARRTPHATAVRSHDGELSYAALDERADELAHRLRGLGVGRGARVGVLLERGTGLLVALLGVLKADAAYVPLDPLHPARRIAGLIAGTEAAVVVTTGALADRVAGTEAQALLLDAAPPPAGPCHRLDRSTGPHDLAYIFHTSGSTGTPKGVQIPHSALTNFLHAMAARLEPRPGDTVLGVTTASFDPSMLELCLPLLTGARLVLADAEQSRDPERLIRLIGETRPDLVQATPSMLRMLVDTGWTPGPGLTVLSGGEKLHTDLAAALAAGGAPVLDLYGPTEATIWTSVAGHDADGRVRQWAAVDNTTVRVLDDRLEPVAEGVTGHVCIGGDGLAWGYRGRPAQTAGVFLPDPHATAPGGRLYATGDLGRIRPDGSLEILGRSDHQVKIRGHRIEPGEIEAALLALDGVRAAVVHPTPDADGGRQLTAYLVAEDPRNPPTPDALRAELLESLPHHLVPATFVLLDAIPTAVSGKVDRHALPVPAPQAAGPAAPPRTPRERSVARVWEEVLGATGIGAHDDFFLLGGHSLLATRVSVRLRAALGVDVPVRALFDHPTVAALATALEGYPLLAADGPLPRLTGRPRGERTTAGRRP